MAVTHGDNHIHIAAILAQQDGRPVRLRNEYYRIGEAMAWAETGVRPARGGPGRPDRAQAADPGRAGEGPPGRAARAAPDLLRRQVEAAAAAARSEAEFFGGLAACGVRVRLRRSTSAGEVTGYAVRLDGDVTASGRPSGTAAGSSRLT